MSSSPFHDPAATNSPVLINPATYDQPGYTALSSVQLQNTNAATVYVQLFDAALATDVILNSTTPTFTFMCPASVCSFFAMNSALHFYKGIVYAVTADEHGTTTPGNACVLNLTIS